MVIVFLSVRVVGSIAPQRIIKMHTVTIKQIITTKLNVEESVQVRVCCFSRFFWFWVFILHPPQCAGMSIAALSAMYLLGTYGAEGKIYNNFEKNIVLMAWSVGIGSLLIPALWKLVVIRNQMKREAEFGPESESEESAEPPLTEASSFWVVVGVLATSFYSAICIAGAVTLDDFYESLTRMAMPLVTLFYGVALFCQPRRNSPKDMWRLRLHFMSFAWISEAATVVWTLREGDSTNVAIHVGLATAETLIFHWGLKLRAIIGRLPEEGETCQQESKDVSPL